MRKVKSLGIIDKYNKMTTGCLLALLLILYSMIQISFFPNTKLIDDSVSGPIVAATSNASPDLSSAMKNMEFFSDPRAESKQQGRLDYGLHSDEKDLALSSSNSSLSVVDVWSYGPIVPYANGDRIGMARGGDGGDGGDALGQGGMARGGDGGDGGDALGQGDAYCLSDLIGGDGGDGGMAVGSWNGEIAIGEEGKPGETARCTDW